MINSNLPEAIAELLHRPLYSVTVGELGTDPVQLESKLREILEVASVWKSEIFNFPLINSINIGVILIDEADIFLERRTRNDIMRNVRTFRICNNNRQWLEYF